MDPSTNFPCNLPLHLPDEQKKICVQNIHGNVLNTLNTFKIHKYTNAILNFVRQKNGVNSKRWKAGRHRGTGNTVANAVSKV